MYRPKLEADILRAHDCVEGLSEKSLRVLVEGWLLRGEPITLAAACLLLAHDVAKRRRVDAVSLPRTEREAPLLSTPLTFEDDARCAAVDAVFNNAALLRHILSFVRGRRLGVISCVCWAFASSLAAEDNLWQQCCKKEYPASGALTLHWLGMRNFHSLYTNLAVASLPKQLTFDDADTRDEGCARPLFISKTLTSGRTADASFRYNLDFLVSISRDGTPLFVGRNRRLRSQSVRRSGSNVQRAA